jgi:hypothetical protein
MVVYRIDFLDYEGRAVSSRRAVHDRDAEVLRAAARLIGRHHAIEVWDNTRVVGQLTAADCRAIQVVADAHPGTSAHATAT